MFNVPVLLGIGGWIAIIAVIVIVFAIICFLLSAYNNLVRGRNKVKNSWAQIDVQLQKRFDLIPNLVETVKGYTKHEADILGAFAKARSLFDRAKAGNDVEGMAKAEGMLTQTLGKLMVVQEQYPELKADKQYLNLQAQLKDVEDKIGFARQFYNDVVLQYNNKREVFPTVIIANMFNFKEEKYFNVEEEAKKAPKVQF